MRRAFPLLFVLALVSVSAAAQANPPQTGESADACLRVQSAPLTEGLAFDLENSCAKRLSCALTWTLTCTNASGRATDTAKKEARFPIGAEATHHTMGSASSCKDSWKIDDVSWDCAPAAK
jgi:hypothetical protein